MMFDLISRVYDVLYKVIILYTETQQGLAETILAFLLCPFFMSVAGFHPSFSGKGIR